MKNCKILFLLFRKKIPASLLFFFAGMPCMKAQTPADYGWQVGYGYSVGATIVKGDTMYVGGDFDYIGHYTGSLVQAGIAGTGAVDTEAWPVVNGTIRTMIADGNNGWFIGGDFTLVNGYSRKGLAHINSSKQLDLSWNVNVNNGARIDALLLSPAKDILWAGGTFSSIGGITCNKVAAINISSRTVNSGWGPGSAIGDNWWGSGTVSALAYYAPIFGLPGDIPRLFIGGDFRNASWQETHLTALDPATGAVLNGWKSDLNHYGTTCCGTPISPVVRSLAIYGRNLYIGGLFSTVTDKSTTLTRQSIAKMDVYTNLLDNSFNADIIPKNDSGVVNCIKLINTPLGVRLGVAGKFRNLNARNVQSFTIVDPGFGLPWPYQNGGSYVNGSVVDTTYTPGTYNTGEIFSFDTAGTIVYLAGNFEGIKGSGSTVLIRRNLAAFNIQNNVISNWAPSMQTDMPVRSAILSGNDIFVAGSFTSAGGWLRRNMAAVDLRKDSILSCNPQPDSYVNAFAFSKNKDTLYIGGNFANIGSSQRGYTAAINVNTNALLPWSTTSATGGGVEDIQLDINHNILFTGGKFTTIGGQAKTYLAALNSTTGAVISGWTANVAMINAQITPVRTLALSITGDTLYVGGRFNTIAGQSRANLAAIRNTTPGLPSTATAALLNWDFPVTPTVVSDIGICALTLYNSVLYAGGKFDAIAGNSTIKNLAAINVGGPTHSLNTSWAPRIEYGGVWCMQPVGNLLYIGGDFGSVNTLTTSFAAALNLSDGSIVSGWLPYPTRGLGGVVLSLMVNNQWVYLGGNQEAMTQNINDAVFHLATLRVMNFSVLSPGVSSFSATARGRSVAVNWITAWMEGDIELEKSNDGINFYTIAYRLQPSGYYTDDDLQAGKQYYYRLKCRNETGIKYSLISRVVTAGVQFFVPNRIRAGESWSINPGNAGSLLTLYNSNGQMILWRNLKDGSNDISTSALKRGIYIYSLTYKGTPIANGRLLIE